MQTSPANTNPFPWNSFPDRLVHFFHLSAKNFSIFATLPSGCSRVSIFHFVGRNRATMATLHRSPSLANKRVEGVERAEGKKEKKIKERARERVERCDETVVYLYRRPYQPSRVVIWTATVAPLTPRTHPVGIYSATEMTVLTGLRRLKRGLARSKGIKRG